MANIGGLFAVVLLAVCWSSVLSVQTLTGNYGCFASPNYPYNYPHNGNQQYRIAARPGSRIKITFITFMLEQESSCRYDYLQIREKDGSVSRKLCGHNNPGEIISLDNELRLEFKSDQSVNSLGFFAAFQMTNDSTPTPMPSPSPVDGGWCPFNWTTCSVSCGDGYQSGVRSCNCPPPSNGGVGCYGDNYVTRNCSFGPCPSSTPLPTTTPSPSCGGAFTGSSGSFNSPGYPNNYPNNAHCTYDIHVPRTMKIVLVIHVLDLESGYDKLELRQMVSGTSNTVAELSGTDRTPRNYTSAENRFTLLFTSDHSVTKRGFSASYYTIRSGPPSVDGGWCAWFQSTPCSASCGYGSQVMRRYCSCPSPSNGGRNCTGLDRMTQSCFVGYCPTSSSSMPTPSSSSTSMPRPSPSPVPTCQPEVHNSPSGIIKSPGYPNNYHNNANCVYNITVQDGKGIKIDFSTFDVEANSGCSFDKLMIFEGDSMVEAATLCGSGSKTFTSRRNKIFMRFTSDGSVTGRGFFGRYQTIDKPQGGGATVNDPSCGIRRVSQSRVIGGTDARKGAWPWQVGMYSSGSFICGGTLIAPNWILTASHCVVSGGRVGSASSFEIVVGDLHRSLNDTTEQKHQVELVIAHPNYDENSINNDIALMKLRTPVMMNDHVLTACIPNKTDVIAVGSTCFITGWGKIQHPGNAHTMLQQAMLPVLNSSFCQSKIDKLGWGLKITDQMVCAGEVGSKKSGCHGDSGGPFVCPDRSGRFYLHGDVSWGSGRCDTSQAYTVFARVTEFVDWIKDTLRDY